MKRVKSKNIFLFVLIFLGVILVYLPLFSGDFVNSAIDLGEGNGQEMVDKIDPDNWNNVAAGWKDKLLNSKFILGMHTFLTKINGVFLILMGERYSFSLFFFFVVELWIIFFFRFKDMLSLSSIFSKWVTILISFGLSVGLAQLGLFSVISKFFIYLVFLPEKPWLGIVIFVGIEIALMFLAKVFNAFKLLSKKGKERLAKAQEEIDRNVFHTQVDSLDKAFK